MILQIHRWGGKKNTPLFPLERLCCNTSCRGSEHIIPEEFTESHISFSAASSLLFTYLSPLMGCCLKAHLRHYLTPASSIYISLDLVLRSRVISTVVFENIDWSCNDDEWMMVTTREAAGESSGSEAGWLSRICRKYQLHLETTKAWLLEMTKG